MSADLAERLSAPSQRAASSSDAAAEASSARSVKLDHLRLRFSSAELEATFVEHSFRALLGLHLGAAVTHALLHVGLRALEANEMGQPFPRHLALARCAAATTYLALRVGAHLHDAKRNARVAWVIGALVSLALLPAWAESSALPMPDGGEAAGGLRGHTALFALGAAALLQPLLIQLHFPGVSIRLLCLFVSFAGLAVRAGTTRQPHHPGEAPLTPAPTLMDRRPC